LSRESRAPVRRENPIPSRFESNGIDMLGLRFFSGYTHLRATAKLLALLSWSALLVPLQLLVLSRAFKFANVDPYTITRLWHRGVCALIGVRVQITGTPMHANRMVYVGNHVSHFDIPVLGSVLKGSFVAKDDMARWPIAGFMARLQQTLFISRDPRAGRAVAESIAAQLQSGRSLILFPEGTTSEGADVLPFKSTIFGILFADVSRDAQEAEISARAVQPLSICVRAVNGRPVASQADRDGYAFYGDMHAGAHAWAFLRSKGAWIELRFAEVIKADAGLDRKALAQRAQAEVRAGLHGGR
jgi:lyso-ornithine lipid O-acyltransferase